jgi:hypothetical protein
MSPIYISEPCLSSTNPNNFFLDFPLPETYPTRHDSLPVIRGFLFFKVEKTIFSTTEIFFDLAADKRGKTDRWNIVGRNTAWCSGLIAKAIRLDVQARSRRYRLALAILPGLF